MALAQCYYGEKDLILFFFGPDGLSPDFLFMLIGFCSFRFISFSFLVLNNYLFRFHISLFNLHRLYLRFFFFFFFYSISWNNCFLLGLAFIIIIDPVSVRQLTSTYFHFARLDTQNRLFCYTHSFFSAYQSRLSLFIVTEEEIY